MGSILKSTHLNPEVKQTLLSVFSKLPYNILWKYEDTDLSDKPNNVRIEKWIPQNDILAHSNIRLFITHGGLLSTIETAYHGVPILGIPIFGDQMMNMAQAEAIGIGKRLDFTNLKEDTLLAAIQEVISDPKYVKSV